MPPLPIAAVAIDSGGHRTGEVMNFSAARLNRRVWAIKGRGGPGVPPWPKRPPKARRAALAPVHIVGVDAIKSTLFARLRAGESEGAGACHFPTDRDYAWFGELVAERAVRKYTRGVARLEWVKDAGLRNEGLDTRVYATAALHGLYAAGWRLTDLAARIKEAPVRTAASAEAVAQPVPAVIRSQFIGTSR